LPASTSPGPVVFVLKGYPRLSESFIAQEIEALERRGLEIRIVSLRHPTDTHRHPVHAEIRAPVTYLPEYLYQEPLRVLAAWRAVRRRPSYRQALRRWLRDLRRDPSPNRVRRFGQALVLARELDADVERLHAHFLHTPASVTRYAAILTGLPWSVSAHAKDIWTIPDWEIAEKLTGCGWLACCSAAACERLMRLAPDAPARERINLFYHGLDLSRFPPRPATPSGRDGLDPADPVRLLSVGRAVEKKGYEDLLQALAALPKGVAWRFEHIGGGPLLEKLKAEAGRLGIAERLLWRGALAQEDVLAAYRKADLFLLASRVGGDGDRDGLPNVLMEAQSQGLACVATRVSGIPELILDGESGILVPERSPESLSAAIAALVDDPSRRHTLGQAGQRRIVESFAHDPWIDRLAEKFGIAGGRDNLARRA
jgi:glycosyltransferase involved in cell wall biosynthesis